MAGSDQLARPDGRAALSAPGPFCLSHQLSHLFFPNPETAIEVRLTVGMWQAGILFGG